MLGYTIILKGTAVIMEYEVSCGYVAYRKFDGKISYLLIRSINGEWGFPKGHIERGESEYETADRELFEETGMSVRRCDGFRYSIEYPLLRKSSVMKRSIYFFGECLTDRIVCQESEVSKACFATFDEAMKLLSFENTREVLRKADDFLRSKSVK